MSRPQPTSPRIARGVGLTALVAMAAGLAWTLWMATIGRLFAAVRGPRARGFDLIARARRPRRPRPRRRATPAVEGR